MTAVKIAISLPPAQLASVKRAVQRGSAPSVSAYVSRALASQEREESLTALVEQLIAEHGEPSAEAEKWAKSAFRPKPRG